MLALYFCSLQASSVPWHFCQGFIIKECQLWGSQSCSRSGYRYYPDWVTFDEKCEEVRGKNLAPRSMNKIQQRKRSLSNRPLRSLTNMQQGERSLSNLAPRSFTKMQPGERPLSNLAPPSLTKMQQEERSLSNLGRRSLTKIQQGKKHLFGNIWKVRIWGDVFSIMFIRTSRKVKRGYWRNAAGGYFGGFL
jgi:hypothetical protein